MDSFGFSQIAQMSAEENQRTSAGFAGKFI